MPGFGFDDDELKKLFAEAGDVVKKKKVADAAPPPPPPVAGAAPPTAAAPAAAPAPAAASMPPAAAAPPAEPSESSDSVDFQVQPMQRAAIPSAEGAVRLSGGEQTDAALVARTTAGATVTIPWGQIKNLSLARVAEKTNVLAFIYHHTLYYFSDDNVAYKGLLKQMAATLAMNWRGLVNEIAARVPDKSDPGIQAVTGAGGSVPKHFEMGLFLKAVRSR